MDRLISAVYASGLILPLFCQAPLFEEPAFLFAGGDTVDVITYSAPCAHDWDSDGDKDLLVGQYVNGHICWFENIGTNQDPVLGDSHFLHADGAIITLPYS
jgi:hypothetical protein